MENSFPILNDHNQENEVAYAVFPQKAMSVVAEVEGYYPFDTYEGL